ncbi:hypothetical protein L1987_81560 [Smallanthus sonchifolius]|uniref:Uncharacterized protein n=1 Tax=Smallanthus sonchifolius TaxID=185202 RepID=A0ACB8YQS7_9ASTR|nr:hypothetical protein L1987_81560 [Smallanthus sonchifolius]
MNHRLETIFVAPSIEPSWFSQPPTVFSFHRNRLVYLFHISGDAFPGRELQASGYSVNGTTSCNFEWVRHMEDGSANYIDGQVDPSLDALNVKEILLGCVRSKESVMLM